MDQAWLLLDFHFNITNWRTLSDQTVAQPTHLAEIVWRKPTHLGFCNALGLSTGGVWLEPSCYGHDLVWQHPWTKDIITNLVSLTNMDGTVTNSDLELAVLVLHEATILTAVPE